MSDDPRRDEALSRYWRSNLRIVSCLLVLWAAVGLGCGVLFADALNAWSIGGFPLGFWFAHQGAIVSFVVLILVYAFLLNRLEARHHEDLERIDHDRRGGPTASEGDAR
ncbi:MAG: DUF4212 domain-containing protein [Planctomycetes bacterium]|nr:DUF4212 domain-containing protein [Planctomycetota bacterium]